MSFRQLAAAAILTAHLWLSSNSFPVTPRAVPDCARNYTVKANDTCDSICAQQNVSTFQLTNVNKGAINAGCNNLFIDQLLCLGVLGHDCTTVHVMRLGETCNAIVAAAGINITTFAANNPNVNSNCSNIYPGEVLCTSATVLI